MPTAPQGAFQIILSRPPSFLAFAHICALRLDVGLGSTCTKNGKDTKNVSEAPASGTPGLVATHLDSASKGPQGQQWHP